jgi:ATP-binding cassette subfamily F protein 3
LFSGDDVEKKIKVLSGGEKARVALAKTIVSKANFLMLDEPTNHLDLHSVELLIEALNKYEGSIVLVSHDRYFVSKIANKIWEISDQQIVEFKGSYDEWQEWRARKEAAREQSAASTNPPKKTEKPVQEEKKPVTPADRKPINQEVKKEYQRVKNQFTQLEKQLNELNSRRAELEEQMAMPDVYADKQRFLETEKKYKDTMQESERLQPRYEESFEKLMQLEERLGNG